LGLVEDVLGNVIVNTDTEPAKARAPDVSPFRRSLKAKLKGNELGTSKAVCSGL